MTATMQRPAPAGSGSRAPRSRRSRTTDDVRRTALALLGSALGVVPLKGLFSDWGWLIDVWLTMIIVIGPAALIRRRRPASALDIWPGIVLMIPWLTLRFVREHALGGIIPGPAAWHDVSLLLVDLHKTTHDDVAPIHTTVAVRLVICALLGLVAALIDLVAVVGHRGALAGVPLLVIYTVAGAVPRQPVSWVWFVFAAAGFLLLLGVDSGSVLDSWGRRVRPAGTSRAPNTLSVTTPRIAVAAVIVAIALPLLVPAQSRNLISDAFHGGGGSGGSGVSDFGGGAVGAIAPFAQLRGQLVRPDPIDLLTVTMQGKSDTEPFYLRTNVLTQYSDDGWSAQGHGATVGIGAEGTPYGSSDEFPYTTEPLGKGAATQLTARISLGDDVRGSPPLFAVPTKIDGLPDGTTWSPQDQLLLGSEISGKTEYTETFDQPEPSVAQLEAAGNSADDPRVASYLDVPRSVPRYVTQLVSQITGAKSSLYDKALAVNRYFTDPDNGFIYSLETKAGNSGSKLEDFLKGKQGYCEQYAAAEAIMFRAAGVPSRVVLGYMHTATDSKRSFTVTTSDAHSWVEAYFPGQGWIPFDPTPSAGLAGGAKTDLQWAKHPGLGGASSGGGAPTISRSPSPGSSGSAAPTASSSSSQAPVAGAGSGTSPTSLTPLWWGIGVLAVLLFALLPAGVRVRRRHARLASPGAEALWTELHDSVVDLGLVWDSARTPRQTAAWLGALLPGSRAQLSTLAEAVERERYARATAGGSGAADLRAVVDELRARRSRGSRMRARWWPASVTSRFGSSGWNARRRQAGPITIG